MIVSAFSGPKGVRTLEYYWNIAIRTLGRKTPYFLAARSSAPFRSTCFLGVCAAWSQPDTAGTARVSSIFCGRCPPPAGTGRRRLRLALTDIFLHAGVGMAQQPRQRRLLVKERKMAQPWPCPARRGRRIEARGEPAVFAQERQDRVEGVAPHLELARAVPQTVSLGISGLARPREGVTSRYNTLSRAVRRPL